MKRWHSVPIVAAGLAFGLTASMPAKAEVDWRQFEGETINVLVNNHPWTQAFLDLLPEFTKKTGIKVQHDLFAEEQYRARMNTVVGAGASDIDGFMTLTIREGAIFDSAGWYADLKPLIEDESLTEADYDYEDFGAALREVNEIGGKIVAIPTALEGPLFYWRKDLFEKCNIAQPMILEELPETAAALRACLPDQGIWASQGLAITIPYSLAAFIYNSGGGFSTPDGQPGLCQEGSVKGLALYANMLTDYGLLGAENHNFAQIVELVGQGRAAMAHLSSNEFANVMKFPGRAEDLGIKVLPAGASGISKPVALSWGVAISAYSERKEATWLLWQWATSREIQAKLLRGGAAPPRASVFNGSDFEAWAAELPIRQAWARALVEISQTGTGIFNIDTNRIPEAREIIGRAVNEIMSGEKTAEQAACDADADLVPLLRKN